MNFISLSNSIPRKFSKNSIVLFQGEIPRYGFIMVEGCLKIYAIDDDGNEKVVGICSKGDIFPTDWLLGLSRSAMFYYETITDSSLLPIQKTEFVDNAELRQYAYDYVSKETASSLLRNLALQQSNATNKILYFLFYLATRHGKEKVKGLFSIGPPLTHQFISDNLGLTRETVAGEVSKLKKSNVLMYRRKHYVIDKSLLIRAVGKEISSNLTLG